MTVEPQMRQEDWQVRLPDFEGPFDLLLHLVRRGELDVSTMPLHEVADEYLEILAQLPEIDVEEAGEFLLVASLLVDLKVKRLEAEFGRRSPEADADAPEMPEVVPDDPAMQLTQALLRYQRVRDAAAELRDLGRAAAGRRPRQAPPHTPGSEPGLDLEDAHVGDLVTALRALAERVDLRRVGDHVIEFDEVPMETLQSELIANLRRSPEQVMPLQTTFADRPAPWRVGMFCATLELVRTQVVMVRQSHADDIIEVRLRPDEASEPGQSSRTELELLPPSSEPA
ncbi:MAG: ScpA family protein [Planctomycetota bacterium]|nr:ScpA family protein [Planctomycetota bacterium]